MATTRLRKAFQYPSDDDITDPAEGVDEEEQEKLISRLTTEDAQKTALYIKIYLLLPLLATIPFLQTLLSPPSWSSSLRALVGITSLACSAYMLAYLPLPPPSQTSSVVPDLVRQIAAAGPVERVVLTANVMLTGVVAGGTVLVELAGGRGVGWAGLLPVGILGFVVFLRTQLRPVDVGGLTRLKYDYKGA